MLVQSLGWEDPLEEEMVTHSNILAWEIPQTEDPGGLHTAHAVVNVGHDLVTKQKHQGVGPVEEGPPGGRRVSQRGKSQR